MLYMKRGGKRFMFPPFFMFAQHGYILMVASP